MARKDAQPGIPEQIAERRVKAFELRKKGNNYREIAKELKVSPATIVIDIKTVLKELAKDQQKEAADYKALELDRLETLQIKMWEQAENGDQTAVDRVLRIMERRAKLLGLDAPTKQEVSVTEIQIKRVSGRTINSRTLSSTTEGTGQ